MKTVIEMALSVVPETDREDAQGYELLRLTYSELERFAELVRADERNATLDEIADKIGKMPFGDTAASFAVWIREQKT